MARVMLPASQPRLIMVDDNIRNIGGHYFELATLLLSGAKQLGYRNVLATHASFDQPQAVASQCQLYPTFHTRRLVRWSLGVDGGSRFRRDLRGTTVGGGRMQNLGARITDQLVPTSKRPRRMLRQWAEDLCRLLEQVGPTPGDSLLVNTGDDFAMLALAAAMQRAGLPCMRIDVVFHFALYDSDNRDHGERLAQLGRQIRSSLAALHPHRVHLHATTDSLASQLRLAEIGVPIRSIPYPTRRRTVRSGRSAGPCKIVLAGLPRAEKGRGAIAQLLAGIEPLLVGGEFQVSMQMPAKRWRKLVPPSLHGHYQRATRGEASGPLEVKVANLSTTDYHRWLDTADLGVFLYDPARYVARCSGVLLEMLVRGVPVIVPAGTWLSDQVRRAGGDRSIGYIYQSRHEIPDLLRQFTQHRAAMRDRSAAYADTITRRHDGANTLREMGYQPVVNDQRSMTNVQAARAS